MFFSAIDWIYRLGVGQLISIGAFPVVLAILLLSAAAFVFNIGMDDTSAKEEEKKVRGDLLKSAQTRVRAYRAGLEQQEKAALMSRFKNPGTGTARKRSSSRGKGESTGITCSQQKETTRKVSFNIS
eukprot:TRINITY_DN31898_c0_g1_i1.p1 TRINITY_DN31898_c0_g1~~TRINITY_DN31898_c0_g1_i1.p1  ORF type:complete len:127 (+),score=23.47 TRINITY_DN31898_c0_g1_i1:86-466(+)